MSESETAVEHVAADATPSRRRPELSSAERRRLRADAHALHPVASVGQRGLTPEVLAEVDHALDAHGLIKVRVFSDDRKGREACLARICDELGCAPVQHLGKLLILWRPIAAQDETSASRSAGLAPSAKEAAAKRKAGGRRTPRARAATTPKHKPQASPKTKGRTKAQDTAGRIGRKAVRSPDEDTREAKASVARGPRGQPLSAMNEPPRPPRSPKAPRPTPASSKAPRAKGRGTTPNPKPGPGPDRSTRASPTVAPRVSGHRTAGGPVGVPRAANPRRRRTKSL